VDNEAFRPAQIVDDGPLYMAKWDPHRFSSGLHTLTVKATDAKNRTRTLKQPFALDKSAASAFSAVLPRMVLGTSFSTVFLSMYLVAVVISILILPLVVIIAILAKRRCFSACAKKVTIKVLQCCICRKLLYVSSCYPLFLFFTLFPVYIAVGPWVMASIVEEQFGANFAWGAVINHKVVNFQTGYLFTFLFLMTFHPWIVLLCGHILESRFSFSGGRRCMMRVQYCLLVLLAILGVAVFLVFFSISSWIQFGILGALLSPVYSWTFLFYGCAILVSAKCNITHKYTGLLQQESKQYTSVHHSKPNSGMDTMAEEGVEDEAAGSNRDLRD